MAGIVSMTGENRTPVSCRSLGDIADADNGERRDPRDAPVAVEMVVLDLGRDAVMLVPPLALEILRVLTRGCAASFSLWRQSLSATAEATHRTADSPVPLF